MDIQADIITEVSHGAGPGVGSGGKAFIEAGVEADLDAVSAGLARVAGALRSWNPGDPHLESTLLAVRSVQRQTDGLVAVLAGLARKLAATGSGPTAEDVLSGDGVVPLNQARQEIGRSLVADQFPAVGQQHRAGAARQANVDVLARLTAKMTDSEVAALARHDVELANAAQRLNEESFRKKVQRTRDRIRRDAGKTAHDQSVEDSRFSVTPSRDKTGYRINGWLDPVNGEAVHAAVVREAHQINTHGGADGLTWDQAMSRAATDLILRGDAVSQKSGTSLFGAPRANVQITVLTDRETLVNGPHDQTIAETENGLPIDPRVVARLCCEATIRRVDSLPDGNVHVSQKTRTATAAQRAALRALYDSCPLSGAPWSQVEIHHVIFYEESQRTVLSELVPISRRWHHLIHDEGWRLDMDADRTLHLYRPDGTHDRTIPRPIPLNQRPPAGVPRSQDSEAFEKSTVQLAA